MPELPDVEIFKRYLDANALHQAIGRVAVEDARILGDLAPDRLAEALTGARLDGSRRHGKHLLVHLSEGRGWLTLHFGMTGGLAYFTDMAADPPYDRVRLDFANGRHLAYTNRRMLGRVGLADDAESFLRDEGLGPDALDPALDLAAFRDRLGRGRRPVKAALMDQAALAGIGNLYADEILFQARLHPALPVKDLNRAQIESLFANTRDVLATAVACGAGAEQFLDKLPKGYLLPQRRKGGRCPRCGEALAVLKTSGRSGYFCPACQRLSGGLPGGQS